MIMKKKIKKKKLKIKIKIKKKIKNKLDVKKAQDPKSFSGKDEKNRLW